MKIARRIIYCYRETWTPRPLAEWDEEPDKVYGNFEDGRLAILYRDWKASWMAAIETKPGGRLHCRSSEQVYDLLRSEGHDVPKLTLHGYASSGSGYWETYTFGYSRAYASGLAKHPWMLGFEAGHEDTLWPALSRGLSDGKYTTLREAMLKLEHFRIVLEAAE